MQTKSTDAAQNSIHVSAVVYRSPVGKKLSLSADGTSVEKEALLAARATTGRLKNLAFESAAEALEYRLSADPKTMFLSGTFDPSLSGARVVPAEQLHLPGPSSGKIVVATTKDYLSFRNMPGLISIDVDVKSADEVEALYTPRVAPALSGRVHTPTSARTFLTSQMLS